jgi:hypothetical protein
MEPHLKIEVRHDVDRNHLTSTFARFRRDCPDRLPVVLRVVERGQTVFMDWLRQRDVPCWYEQDEIDGLSFAPVYDSDFLHEIDYLFRRAIQVIGPD